MVVVSLGVIGNRVLINILNIINVEPPLYELLNDFLFGFPIELDSDEQ
jgi:hypothetical protein